MHVVSDPVWLSCCFRALTIRKRKLITITSASWASLGFHYRGVSQAEHAVLHWGLCINTAEGMVVLSKLPPALGRQRRTKLRSANTKALSMPAKLLVSASRPWLRKRAEVTGIL